VDIASSPIDIHIAHERKRALEDFQGVGRISNIGYNLYIASLDAIVLTFPEGTTVPAPIGLGASIGKKGIGGIIAFVVWRIRKY